MLRSRSVPGLLQFQFKDGKQKVTERLLFDEAEKCSSILMPSTLVICCIGGVDPQVRLLSPQHVVTSNGEQAMYFPPKFVFRKIQEQPDPSDPSGKKKMRVPVPFQLPENLDVVVLLDEGMRVLLGSQNLKLLKSDRLDQHGLAQVAQQMLASAMNQSSVMASSESL